jgi:Ca-activated chloride channel family protein
MSRLSLPSLAALAALAALAGLVPVPALAQSNAVRVTADLERGVLPKSGGETFVRIVLEGQEAATKTQRLPVSLTIVIDESGSMSGDKIEAAKRAALVATEELLTGDKLAVVAFSTSARTLVEPLEIGRGDIERARRQIKSLTALDSTNMAGGLRLANTHAARMHQDGRTSRVLLVSDGQPDSEAGLVDQVTDLQKLGIGTTTLGIGRDYNENLMARLADAGLGNYFFAENTDDTRTFFAREISTLAAVVAKEAMVQITPRPGVVVDQVFGYEAKTLPGKSASSGALIIPVGDIYSGRRADMLARVRYPKSEALSAELVEVKVTYQDMRVNTPARHILPLAARFSDDKGTIEASISPDVATKAEKVRTAIALEKATEEYKKGNVTGSRAIIQEQKARNASLGSMSAPAAAAGRALDDDLDALAEEAEAPAADKEVYSKRAKAKSRDYKKY